MIQLQPTGPGPSNGWKWDTELALQQEERKGIAKGQQAQRE